MKTTLVIATLAAAAFAAGMMTSCSRSTDMAPTSVAPIPQGSYTIGGTK